MRLVGVTDKYTHLQRVGQKVPEPDVVDMRGTWLGLASVPKVLDRTKWACEPGGRSQQGLGMGLDRDNTQHSLHHFFSLLNTIHSSDDLASYWHSLPQQDCWTLKSEASQLAIRLFQQIFIKCLLSEYYVLNFRDLMTHSGKGRQIINKLFSILGE